MPLGLSYYLFPLISALCWIGTLLGLLIHWEVNGRPHYASMADNQRIAYISDVGAQKLKPLFIAGSSVTIVCFDIVFILENWLRHRGRLAPHTKKSEKICSILACIFSVVGGAGLILLSIFDTLRHPKAHDRLLGVFIVGYVITAIFVCIEYQRLGINQRQYRLLRISFWLKLFWIFLFVALAIVFGVYQRTGNPTRAAIFEWIIAFLYSIFVASFAIDFLPAIRFRSRHNRFAVEAEKGNMNEVPNQLGGPADYTSEGSEGSHQPMSNGRPTPSRNF
ncbi:hypothetical protein K461DRAFT_323888 [Myriangium duriaei CBS 260.36]|uniref:CWH43-like N-terminal domain-containing protein n=1 Tax=Myriangium duriaei CBS 260.36 TaxID=1168546 RepID=A0A9P4MGW7_9PEZI|nr:hypothetical protein K461DRAFT_323888 [Myriangium duriaei CBS 260.36]